ncbi:hypothetical protein BBC27_05800 [Acidithiobacillus ferrivorans]|uniref:Uncharacterized protein n=1 Tax=Acidithiobacillus ferrivorans TaxID=160808 RepID=A0A1B9C1Q9_9PROT|nr:hypothetical protein [Acidithiobacillus ferrivorans]OCB03908.1 hypothetical protein BBC27_05800 [Acidithiobacillus ferrivorans]
MTDLYELPNRPAARVAICRASIEDAMSRGFTLKEIAARLDVKYKTFWQAWKEARIVVDLAKQVALPALPVPDKECFRVPNNSSSSTKSEEAKEVQQESEQKTRKALARVTDSRQKPESEMSAAEKIIAKMNHI